MRRVRSEVSLTYRLAGLNLGEVQTVIEALNTKSTSLRKQLSSGMYDANASSILRDKLSQVERLNHELHKWICEVHK